MQFLTLNQGYTKCNVKYDNIISLHNITFIYKTVRRGGGETDCAVTVSGTKD
jgi:hypothetical protein